MGANGLIGTWVADVTDQVTRERCGDVTMSFEANGSLTYAVRTQDKKEIILLGYRVDGDQLITDQPSAPREERTQFAFTSDGRLELTYGEIRTYFVRESAIPGFVSTGTLTT
jgi:hypothetical protein